MHVNHWICVSGALANFFNYAKCFVNNGHNVQLIDNMVASKRNNCNLCTALADSKQCEWHRYQTVSLHAHTHKHTRATPGIREVKTCENFIRYQPAPTRPHSTTVHLCICYLPMVKLGYSTKMISNDAPSCTVSGQIWRTTTAWEIFTNGMVNM